MIMGGCGAGKSTLAKTLSEEIRIPAVHLDALHWAPGWKERDKDEFLKLYEEAVSKDEWIIDGNYSKTIKERIELADTIIYLDFSTWDMLCGVIKRRFQYRGGTTRPDIGKDCPEKIDWEFLSYVWTYNSKRASKFKQMISGLKDKNVIFLKNRKEVDEYLVSLRKSS